MTTTRLTTGLRRVSFASTPRSTTMAMSTPMTMYRAFLFPLGFPPPPNIENIKTPSLLGATLEPVVVDRDQAQPMAGGWLGRAHP